ncbi:type II toxin-antitoxin system PemK/MazF family toxin [Xylanimonas allomyrinae]|uniref:type II toxin-antitoxin system PemK/MazF family toxin n=1 Tax=Xylanimonas allomyrinae TaxID=2509459 RepID=UPI001FE7D237|nr:type II toxin-antitoxin system PemK/MazF family toxin [Xylanimonas allomyrinae]
MANRWVNVLVDVARAALSGSRKRTPTAGRGAGVAARPARDGGTPGGRTARPSATTTRPRPTSSGTAAAGTAYPGDYLGTVRAQYAPRLDGAPDPGEIVWTRVPFEEDPAQGKDRPVLLVGRDGSWLLALQLTSKDHDRDAAQEARAGRLWMDIGTGAWDTQGRPSEVRLNRVIRIDPVAVRRIGAVLPEPVFRRVVAAMNDALG